MQRLLREGDAEQEAAPVITEDTVSKDSRMAESDSVVEAQNVTLTADYQQMEAVAAELPAAVEAGLEQALVQVMGQNARLRSDLADVLVELEAIRRKILA